MKMKTLGNQSGSVLITFSLVLMVFLGFIALGTDAATWYLVRSQLSKAVDAASLMGAKNISNPFEDPATLARQIGLENFSRGFLGTPGQGETGQVTFTATMEGTSKVRVRGRVNTPIYLASLFDVDSFRMDGYGTAEKKDVEIMMVLDRSGSMSGTPMADLKEAALSFLSFFEDTEDKDKMGLISFSTGVTVDHALSTYFVDDIQGEIAGMNAVGATNAEDAIDQSGGPSGFTDQSGIPGDQHVQQFLIFFSDGNPTAFRGQFRRNATNYNAVVMGTGQHCDTVWDDLANPTTGNNIGVDAIPTGDGNRTSGSPLTVCGHYFLWWFIRDANTRWFAFEDYPVPGYDPLHCNIPGSVLAPYICDTARAMAIDHADDLKATGVKVYTIGLGDIDQDFLSQIASGPSYEYYTPNSSDLQALFNAVAKEIKLRLVQ
ncbi:MAG: VWA domain-containing protein [bacterium]